MGWGGGGGWVVEAGDQEMGKRRERKVGARHGDNTWATFHEPKFGKGWGVTPFGSCVGGERKRETRHAKWGG